MSAPSRNPFGTLLSLARHLRARWRASGRGRSPKKLEAFRVLRGRGVTIDAVVDVGVLHGTPELIESFADVPHFLFEPVGECAESIGQAYSGISHTLIQKAVGSSDGTASMRILGEAGSLHSSAHLDAAPSAETSRQTDVVTLDSYAGEFGSVENCLLKVDTDGHEISVLHGGAEFLRRCAVAVVEVTQANLSDVVSFMSERDFVIFDIVEPCYFDDALWQVDVIFVRSDLHAEKFESIVDNDFDKSKYQIYR